MHNGISLQLKRRIFTLIISFVALTFAMCIRLSYVQLVEGDKLQTLAEEQQTRDRTIAPTRGNIYDRNLNVLAKSASVATIGVVHAQIQDPERVAKVLTEHLNMDYETVYKKVTKRVAFERIATKVDKSIADEIRALNLPGVKVDEDSKRYYPFNTLASQTIGFVGKDNQGIVGLEVKYDSYLKGTPGKILMETNGKGQRREEEVEVRIDPTNGNHLVSTLDLTLQQYAEQAIEKAVQMKGARRGAIIMMNPQNGEIYALAIKPDFNLNEPFTINNEQLASSWNLFTSAEKQNYLNQMWRNFTINDTYEPGSTFKVFTSAMGLEEGVVDENSSFNCSGSKTVAGRTIKCWRSPRAHGQETFVQGVQNSCNPVFMEVAERIGASKFYDYMIKFGFKSKTNIDLPGEAVGILHSKSNIGPVELATMSFGQSFQITPMQLLSASAAAVNGGYKVTPHFGKEVIDDSGNVITTFDFGKGEQIISAKTSERLKKILESVVSEGGGHKAYIPGYHIGGKTATSQKLPRGSGKYTASFMSFAPADNPIIMTLVIIDEPQGTYYGGAIAGPVMKEVLENALPYLGIQPDYTQEELQQKEVQKVTVPDFRNMTIKDAKNQADEVSIEVEIQGEGQYITSQFPMPGEMINKTTKIILYTQ
ncbi:MAG: penicillin-binding transpeptidase domain-containing protein [Cellulosilyticum sp.]|nr:penicillin-binding transpeptidase domain-containing protein [Cellulosilyticum sp.]